MRRKRIGADELPNEAPSILGAWILSTARSVLSVNPLVGLAASAAVVLAGEYARSRATFGHPRVVFAEAVVSGAGLLLAWHGRERIGLVPLLVLVAFFQVGWLMVHLKLGVPADHDSRVVYPAEGNAVVAGHYPRSEYPPGGVMIFALDAWLGNGATDVSHAFVMIPFQLVAVGCVWELRTSWSPWFAAIVGLWPVQGFLIDNKYDAAPTAFLVLAIVLALRERWTWAGVALGVGAWLKWTPALTGIALAIWLLAADRRRDARALVVALAGSFALLNLPFFLWSPHNVLAAYTTQGSRGITAESVFYLPLRLVGLAEPGPSGFWTAATVPSWANGVAIVIQALIVVGILACIPAQKSLSNAVTLAVIVPAAFLLTNRIYSPQFAILLLVTWAIAGSLLARNRYEQLVIGGLGLAATLVNGLIYPALIHPFAAWSAAFYLLAFSATCWAFLRARAARA